MKLYVIFCPMTFDGKGTDCLSVLSEIRNPYFGGKRLSYLSASTEIYIESPVAFPFMPIILISGEISVVSQK